MRYIVYDINQPEKAQPETLVILGFPATGTGQPGFILKSRLDTALTYLQNQKVQKIIVTGGAAHNSFEEADIQKQYLVAHNIDESLIVKEPDSVNTLDNALNVYRLTNQLQLSNLVVVTSHYHKDRAAYIFSHYFQSYKIVTPIPDLLYVLKHLPYYLWDKYALYRIKKGDERLKRK